MDNTERYCLVPFSELLDKLSIDQIKEILVSEHRASFTEELQRLTQEINPIIKEKGIKLTARFIRLIIILAQINLHIWHTKEIMINEPDRFESTMKLGHQLNGIRNQVKNFLLEEAGFKEPTGKKTNINTDNLEGWNISI